MINNFIYYGYASQVARLCAHHGFVSDFDGLRISVRSHPENLDDTPLVDRRYILNYTAEAQYGGPGNWSPLEMVARGLIINGYGEIIAAPYAKFFNWNETADISASFLRLCVHGQAKVSDKLDGCFPYAARLNLWDGGTVEIGEVVHKHLDPVLIGMDENGNVVPCRIVEWFNNGTKDKWVRVTVSNRTSRKSGAGGHKNSILVTPNHHFYINGQFRPVGEARIGDSLVSYTMHPSDSVIHLIRSGLLGDGCVTKGQNGYRYQESHKESHTAYVDAINLWMGECATSPRQTVSGYGSNMNWAHTREMHVLEDLRAEWYGSGKKSIPQSLEWMDDFTVAKWYMDDGSLSHTDAQQDRANFATNGFCKEDVERLAERLTDMYGVDCAVYFSKGWCLRVNAGRDSAIDVMWRAIAPHVVECMRYKLPLRYRDVNHKPYPHGELLYVPIRSTVIDIQDVKHTELTKKNFPSGRVGFDIKTTTGNYFLRGVLVHNSMGILYTTPGGRVAVATRGSFTSPQAEWATAYLQCAGERDTQALLKRVITGTTVIVEIISDDNRIVLDYGDIEGLFVTGGRDMSPDSDYWAVLSAGETLGRLAHIPMHGLRPFYNMPDYDAAGDPLDLVRTAQAKTGIEGWVVTFPNGEMFKIKTADYFARHKMLFSYSDARIVDACEESWDTAMRYILDLPDELYPRAKEVYDRAFTAYTTWLQRLTREYARICDACDSRKQFAQATLSYADGNRAISAVLFALLDGSESKVRQGLFVLTRADIST